MLSDSDLVSHGTTVGTNAIIEGEGTRAGLVTTRGAEDVMFIMRAAAGRSTGLPTEEVLRFQESTKPDPIVPKDRVVGIDERIDCMGETVVEFDEERAREAARQLDDRGVDSVAVSFLWSFLDSTHEKQMAEVLEDELDDTYVTRSSELIPKWGEYERTAATAINAYIGPTTAEYIRRIDDRLGEAGYEGTLLVMQSGGGVMSAADAVDEPLRTIDSGPVGGLIGCRYLADLIGHDNVIAGDMGGTSFDIGLLIDGEPLTEPTNVINQYEYMMRTISTKSIGSGGGSIASVDGQSNRLRVGPQSAGADPGPACYGQGGTQPTVTDADLLLGFLDEDDFLGGRATLDVDQARNAVQTVADDLGMDVVEAASGIVRIANAKMADMIRQRTVNEGHDPRNFVMYAYGGAGPLHVPALAEQLGIDEVVVPGGSSASVWSAVGVSSSDVLHRREVSDIRTAPFNAEDVTAQFRELADDVRADLREEGFEDDEITIERYADLRYQAQVHQLSVPVPSGDLDDDDLRAIIDRFEQAYEGRYGEGAGYSESGFELVTVRCDGYGRTVKPDLETRARNDTTNPRTTGDVYWPGEGQFIETPRYHDDDTGPGTRIEGPAVVGMEHTTIAVPPDNRCEIDSFDNYVITHE